MTEVKEALKEQRKLVKTLRDELAQAKDGNVKAGLEKKIAHAEKSLTKLQDEVRRRRGPDVLRRAANYIVGGRIYSQCASSIARRATSAPPLTRRPTRFDGKSTKTTAFSAWKRSGPTDSAGWWPWRLALSFSTLQGKRVLNVINPLTLSTPTSRSSPSFFVPSL
jgi:hypothetical protein